MLTPEQALDLGRRLVACKGFRWMPGMLMHANGYSGKPIRATGKYAPAFPWPGCHVIPDLRDPSTLGCLMALVREAWGDPHGFLNNHGDNEMWNEIDQKSVQHQADVLAHGEDITWLQQIEGDLLRPREILPLGTLWHYHPFGQETDPVDMGWWSTEAEALVVALEAAP